VKKFYSKGLLSSCHQIAKLRDFDFIPNHKAIKYCKMISEKQVDQNKLARTD